MEEKESEINNPHQTKKVIPIVGTSTRYQLKRVTQDMNVIKNKKYTVCEKEYTHKEQIERLFSVPIDPTFSKCLHEKVSSYKQQDKLKKLYEEVEFIKYEDVMKKLEESGLLCRYCNKEMVVLFNHVREMKQWTLDRIDNSLGHTNSNTVVACLECNLQRRTRNMSGFDFTKKMVLVKSSS